MSLSLLRLMFEQDSLSLLIIGAYRANEVDGAHPLMVLKAQLLELDLQERTAAMQQSQGGVGMHMGALQEQLPKPRLQTLLLQPLSCAEVVQLLQDTFHCTTAKAAPLGALLHQQTSGSPFFVRHTGGAAHSHARCASHSLARSPACRSPHLAK
jgi:predicted ATPase